MASERDPAKASEEGAGRASSLGGPILAVGAFAAGAAVTLVAKRLLDARRKAGIAGGELAGAGDGSKEDLATVLRRAALDVAVVATGQAAERLRSQGEQGAPADEGEPEAAESSSR